MTPESKATAPLAYSADSYGQLDVRGIAIAWDRTRSKFLMSRYFCCFCTSNRLPAVSVFEVRQAGCVPRAAKFTSAAVHVDD
jgi:hypothetical protein